MFGGLSPTFGASDRLYSLDTGESFMIFIHVAGFYLVVWGRVGASLSNLKLSQNPYPYHFTIHDYIICSNCNTVQLLQFLPMECDQVSRLGCPFIYTLYCLQPWSTGVSVFQGVGLERFHCACNDN